MEDGSPLVTKCMYLLHYLYEGVMPLYDRAMPRVDVFIRAVTPLRCLVARYDNQSASDITKALLVIYLR